MKSIIRLATTLVASVIVAVPSLAFAGFSIGIGFTTGSGSGMGSGGSDITGVAGTILYLINDVLVPVLFALAFIVFLYGVATKYIFSRGDEGKIEEGHKLILWGVIGFVVMISLWGLVNVVSNTFGLSGYYAPPLPSTYQPS
ncbi:hypothetical protein HKL94_01605 [Candidatus Parcubacteria bacterium]|nr:hypothetical protein [Candidatus Parcubacteria bacterium]